MKALIAKFGPPVLHGLLVVAGFLNPAMQAYIGSHPGNSVLMAALWMQVMHLLQSPLGKK